MNWWMTALLAMGGILVGIAFGFWLAAKFVIGPAWRGWIETWLWRR